MSHDLFKTLIEQVFAGVGMAIAALLGAVLLRLFRRLGIQVSAEQSAAIDQGVKRVVLAVAEKAANKVGTSGAEKLALATAAVEAKFPKLTAADVDTHIHAAVAELGVGASTIPATLTPLPVLPPPLPEVK